MSMFPLFLTILAGIIVMTSVGVMTRSVVWTVTAALGYFGPLVGVLAIVENTLERLLALRGRSIDESHDRPFTQTTEIGHHS